MKRLVILDVNGVLCHKEHIKTKSKVTARGYIETGKYRVYPRPGAAEFVERCFSQNIEVGIYSFMNLENTTIVLNCIFKPQIIDKLKFILTEGNGIQKYKSVDEIKRKIDNLDEYRIIIVDDSAEKVDINNPDEYIVAQTYDPNTTNIDNAFDVIFDRISDIFY